MQSFKGRAIHHSMGAGILHTGATSIDLKSAGNDFQVFHIG